jgi:hypothetical protein
MLKLQTLPKANDRGKEFDVCIITCDDSVCHQEPVMTLLRHCKKAGLKYFQLTSQNIHRFEEQISSTIVTAMIVCKHNEKEFSNHVKRVQTKSIVIAGSIGRVQSPVLQNIISNVENKANMSRLFDEIRRTVSNHCQHNDVRQKNPDTLSYVDEMVPRRMQMIPRKDYDETSLKQVSNPNPIPQDDLKNEDFEDAHNRNSNVYENYRELTKTKEYSYMTLINTVQTEHTRSRENFIKTKSLMSSDSGSGTFVYGKYVLPTNEYDGECLRYSIEGVYSFIIRLYNLLLISYSII